jgi:hypothetical protein
MVTTAEPKRATNYRSGKMPQGMMDRGLERNSFPPRKPLIQKKEAISRTTGSVRIELHSARWERPSDSLARSFRNENSP